MRHSHIGIACVMLASTSLVAQEKAGTTLWRALGSMVENKKQQQKQAEEAEPLAMPQNSLANPASGVTPTGSRLQPFGQPNYWGNTQQPIADEDLVDLPPLPDLRTPDQISKTEQRRNFRNAKYTLRHAENQAKQEAMELEAAAQIANPPQDPSTAMFQVQSQADYAPSSGVRELPNAAGGGKLKPFGDASYIENGQVRYRGDDGLSVPMAMAPEEEAIVDLPPLPDLRTPDQISKTEQRRNFRNGKFTLRRAENVAKEQARELEEAMTLAQPEQDPATAMIVVQSTADQASVGGQRALPNASGGGKLKPFGDAAFVQGGQVKFRGGVDQVTDSMAYAEEESIVELPPLPDLRTPDQVSQVEQRRNLFQGKFAARSQKQAAMQQDDLLEHEVVPIAVDPATALVQVQSKADTAYDAGSRDRPSTMHGGKLKPFNGNSSFVQGGQLKFQHTDHEFIEPAAQAMSEEDMALASLPPLPDLRTPDQVSKVEQKRYSLLRKFGNREPQVIPTADGDLLAEAETMVDPSQAIHQVQSKVDGAHDAGRWDRPTTMQGGKLKPFNGGSSFVKNGELKYQHSDHVFEESMGAAGASPEDDALAALPPLPDLRTPDQVTKKERARNMRLLKYRARQAREDAQRADDGAGFPTLEPYRAQ